MSFEIDKLSEKIQQKIKQVFFEDQTSPMQNAQTEALSAAESQDLLNGLSGESMNYGTLLNEPDNISNSLSGSLLPLEDVAEFTYYQNNTESNENQNEPWTFSDTFIESFQNLNTEEKYNFITQNIINALQNNNFTELIKLLGMFYQDECKNIHLALSGEFESSTPAYLPLIACLNVSNLSELLENLKNNPADEIIKQNFVLNFVNNIGEKLKMLSQKPDENILLLLSEDIDNKNSDNEINQKYKNTVKQYFEDNGFIKPKEKEIYHEKIMPVFNHQEEMIEFFKTLGVKEFRNKISQIETISNLNIIRNLIDTLSFSKADKQMLQNECAKQQGKIQTTLLDNTKKEEEQVFDKNTKPKTDFNIEQQIKSNIEFNLYNDCKTPYQRELAKFFINDIRFFSNKENFDIIKQVIKKCKSKQDLENTVSIIKTTALSHIFVDKDGNFNSDFIKFIGSLSNENIKYKQKLLNTIVKKENNSINKENKTEKINSDKSDAFKKVLLSEDNEHSINISAAEKILETYIEYTDKNGESDELTEAFISLSDTSKFASFIRDFIQNENNQQKSISIEQKLVNNILKRDTEIYTDFIAGRAYTDEQLVNLFNQSQKQYGKDILNNMCKQREFSAEDILVIMEHTPQHRVNLTKKIINTNYLTATQKAEAIKKIDENPDIASEIEQLMRNDDFNINMLPKILNSTINTIETNSDFKE